jgi:hypothetical protein
MSLAGLVLFKAPASSFIAVRLVLFSYLGRGAFCARCGVCDTETLLVLGYLVLRFAKPVTA